MRIRGVLCGAILLVAAAGCADQAAPEEPGSITATVAWTEPEAYKFTFRSSCGERPLIGTYAATVESGTVTGTEGLDEPAQRSLMLRIANLVPTLGAMVDEAKAANGQIEYDPADGHPTAIRIDPDPVATDDESCYEILEYTIGVQPEPSIS